MKFLLTRNFFSGCFFLLTLLSRGQVVINEYSCSNLNGPTDNYGDREDWIELYNAGTSPVNLAGYYLSDKAGNPAKWQIPSGTIAAGGFMLIWASGRDTVVGTNRHTNFKLTQTKPEKIILSDPSATIIDSLTLAPTLKDNSRGRNPNGGLNWAVYTTVTAGTSNTNPQQEYATKPAMSLAPGFYTGTQTVTITSPDANVTIRYTTNGSSPINSSPVYSTPITISSTTVLRAKAFSSVAGIPSSFVESNTYFINSPHTIPVFSVFGGTALMDLMNGNQGDPESGLEYFDKTGTFKTESYGTSNKHGNDSWSYEQRGIDFVSYDQYGYNYALQEKLFNYKTRTEFQRVILKASAGDNYPFETDGSSYQWGGGAPEEGACHIRDQYVHTLSQRGGLNLDERTWEPCIVYVNGEYWGVYDLREKVDDNDFLDYYYDQFEKYDGSSQYVQFLKTWGGTWSEFGGTQAQTNWDNLRNYITSNNMAVPANFAYVDSLYNWKSLIDYFVLNSYVVTSDWLNWNTAWWRGLEPNGNKKKWRYVLWDLDATFGHYVNYTGVQDQNPTADPCNPEQLGDPGGQGHVEILNALMDNQTFYQYYVSRYIDLSNTVFQCSYMIGLLDSMVAIIQPEMQAQINKWAPIAGTGSMNDWLGNVQELKDFINQRCAAMSVGMDSCYSVTGPYNLTVDVVPASSGTVTVNSITPTSYAYNGSYYGNINILLNANASTGYVFDYWESTSGDTINPDTLNPAASFNIEGTDTIIAHFKPSASLVDLTVLVSPSGSGKVDLNGTVINTYPYNNSYPSGSSFGIIAVPNPGFSFSYWTLNNNIILPNTSSDTAAFSLNAADTLVAYFDSVPQVFNYLDVQVNPPGSGNVTLNGVTPPSYPYDNTYPSGTVLNMIGIPNSGFNFIQWTLNNHTINPNNFSATADFTITSDDTLIAYFDSVPPTLYDLTVIVNPPNSGNVNLEGTLLSSYPYNSSYNAGTNLNFIAIANTGFSFNGWQSLNNTVNPNSSSDTASLVLNAGDTLIAYFDSVPPPVLHQLTVMVSPASSGNVNLDGIVLNTYPFNITYAEGSDISFGAIPASNYEFDYWTILNHSLSPDVNSGNVLLANFIMDDTVTAYFKEIPDTGYKGIFIPTGFSPNDDHNNDILFVFSGKDVVSFQVNIYDRWGNLVFQTSEKTKGWDGTYKGKKADIGVYAYQLQVKFKDGSEQTKGGDITLVR